MKANEGKCQLTTSRLLDSYNFFSFILTKDFSFKDEIDKQLRHSSLLELEGLILHLTDFRLLRLRENGIIEHLAKRYLPPTDKCRIKNMDTQSTAGNPLGIYAMVSAFIVLAIGVGSSLIVFALELIVNWASRGQKIEPKKNPTAAPEVNKLIDLEAKIFNKK